MKTIELADRLELTVKRPNGITETIVHPTLKGITETQFKQIQRDTKAAGRGEVLFYHNYTKKVVVSNFKSSDSGDSEIIKMMRMGE